MDHSSNPLELVGDKEVSISRNVKTEVFVYRSLQSTGVGCVPDVSSLWGPLQKVYSVETCADPHMQQVLQRVRLGLEMT